VLKYVLFLAAPFLCAQSLHIPPSAASQQLSGSFLVILTSPAGRSPLALQWKMLVPGDVLINLKDVAPGSAAESAQKSITCAAGKNLQGKEPSYSCIVAGGQKTISNGPVAVVRYKLNEKTRARTFDIKIEDALGVSANLKKTDIAAVTGVITIP
jgi:hypothetical protein